MLRPASGSSELDSLSSPMRLIDLHQRASELNAEIVRMEQVERDYKANPGPSLSDLHAHRERQERCAQILEELAKLAEETAH